jgi:hypothetical protein
MSHTRVVDPKTNARHRVDFGGRKITRLEGTKESNYILFFCNRHNKPDAREEYLTQQRASAALTVSPTDVGMITRCS